MYDVRQNPIIGTHVLAELYGVTPELLTDRDLLKDTLTVSASLAGATVLDTVFYGFDQDGVTGLVLLAESHISIHTWPEIEFASVDIYTCGNCEPEKAVYHVIECLEPVHYSVRTVDRGYMSIAENHYRHK